MRKLLIICACIPVALSAPLRAAALRAQAVAPPHGAAAEGMDTLTLSLGDAQRLALEGNPEFLADRQAAAVARGELRQAGLYRFNPEVEFEAPGSLSAGGLGAYEARVGQRIEWAGQWGLREDAARAGLARASHEVRDAARLTAAAASAAYYRALAAERRLDVAEEIFALNERLLEAVRAQLRAGEISALDANLAEIEYGRARARVLAARREATTTRLALKRRIGMPPGRPVRLVADDLPAAPDPASLRADSLVATALARRPDVAARSAAVEEFETRERLARREAIPDVNIGAYMDREGVTGERRFGVGIGLPLPFWNRNQGRVAANRARAERAAYALRAAELAVRTEVVDAHRTYVAASEEAHVFERSVLGPARENQRSLERAYEAGKIDLPQLLLLRNQLLDAELGYWDAWLARREALVRLQAATASLGMEDSP